MSRTFKDKPYKFREDDFSAYNKEDKPKKKKDKNTVYWWVSTPSWWTNMFMNRPMRHIGRIWEAKLRQVRNLEELEEDDSPGVSKKPHVYYW